MSVHSAVKKANHFLWLGPLLAIAGLVSYFAFFVRFPVLRDFPWLNVPVIWIGLVVTAMGVVRGFRSRRGRIVGSLGMLVSLIAGGFFHFYVFYLSYQLPESSATPVEQAQAPDFTLPDQQGRAVTLSDFRGRNVVLVFYRGHW